MIFPLRAILALMLARLYPTGLEPLGMIAPGRDPDLPLAAALAAILLAGLCRLAPGRFGRLLTWPVPLLAHAALLFVFHWPLWIEEATPLGASASGIYLGSLLPYLLMAAASTPAMPTAGRRLRWAFTAAPISMILVLNVASIESEALLYVSLVYPFALVPATLAAAALLLVTASPFLRLLLGARPLPPGPVRDRLEAMASAAGFRCRDFVVFGESDGLVNAFVAGPFAAVRYVFLSRALIDRLSARAIECVAAHEMAHSLLMHIGTIATYVAALTLVLSGSAEAPAIPEAAALALLPAAFAAAAAFFVWTSRRFESEADVAGAGLVRSPLDLAAALDRVAVAGGIDRRRPSWRHFSIDRRIRILLDPSRIRLVLAQARLARGAIAGLLALGLTVFALAAAIQIDRAPEREGTWAAIVRAEAALRTLEAGDAEGAARDLRAVIDVFDHGYLRYQLSRAYARQGLDAMAIDERRRAREMNPIEPRARLDLELNRP